HRPGALGGEIGEVHRHQLPGDVARRVGGEEMHPLDQHVVGKDEAGAAQLEQSGVVEEAAGGRVRGDGAEAFDEGGLAAYARTCFATASRSPLTKDASFLS